MAEIARQPGPVAELWEWQYLGLCRTVSPEVFFHPEGERGPARSNRDDGAKPCAAGCPVIEQCRGTRCGSASPTACGAA